jgi:hypothetical protein
MGGLGSPLPGGRRKGEIDVDAMRSAIAASIERGRAGKQLEDTVKAIGNKAALFDLLIEMQHMDGDSTYAFSYMFVTGSEDIWANRGTKGVQFTYPTIIDGHKQDRETTVTLNVETDENGFDSVREDFKKIREWEAARKTFEKERIEFIDTLTDRQRELMNLPKKR